jgi:hypothetical protein
LSTTVSEDGAGSILLVGAREVGLDELLFISSVFKTVLEGVAVLIMNGFRDLEEVFAEAESEFDFSGLFSLFFTSDLEEDRWS